MYDGIGKYVYIFFLQSSNGREKCDKMFGNTNKREHGGTMRADIFFFGDTSIIWVLECSEALIL
jgi:hypothetical protein